ncbi:sigma-70 family RNA polymerase sigma factor [Amycolatopsis sp. cmx-4-61]|uniref:sigma-70 family RNA polymerase sigma factor n=1 Tax=Amycolatopsis sp. cmx-4-61 TaxID=2790937 RepID=UPI00397AF0B7
MLIDSEQSEICQLLLQRAGQGDIAAFAGLYDRTAPAVYGLIHSVLPDAGQADDATLEVYLQTWRGASRFDPDRDDAYSLLMAIARRYVLDRIRTAPTHNSASGLAHRAKSGEDTDFTGRPSCARVLAVVPAACREVLVWSYFGGQSLVEVAELLGIPEAEAVCRLNDALASLRQIEDAKPPRRREDAR